MTILKRIWHDSRGFIASTDLLLLSVVLVIGIIVGIVTLRDQVVQELGDLASALGKLNQSYSYEGDSGDDCEVAGSEYEDLADFCEEDDSPGAEPACITISGVMASDEGQMVAPDP